VRRVSEEIDQDTAGLILELQRLSEIAGHTACRVCGAAVPDLLMLPGLESVKRLTRAGSGLCSVCRQAAVYQAAAAIALGRVE
jgi:hypothetical protein